ESDHFDIASAFFCCNSCWLIASLTCVNGVFFAGLTAESAWITCQPYCVCTGFESSFVFSENATLSNGGTVCPFEIVSFPPWLFEPGSCEYFFASAAKSAPPFSCAYSLSAVVSSFTRIWRTSRVAGCEYCSGC